MIAIGQASGLATPVAAQAGSSFVISPEVAKSIYEQLAPLRLDDGCRLTRFDTQRSEITIELQPSSGGAARLRCAPAATGGGLGPWALADFVDAEQRCPETVSALRQILTTTAAPRRSSAGDPGTGGAAAVNRALLPACLTILLVATFLFGARALIEVRPPPSFVLLVVAISVAGIGLRLTLSPRTFLHEYFHAAETAWAYLTGENPLPYGDTGPTIIRLVAHALGRPFDVHVIFLSTLAVSSLAIPLVAIVTLQLTASWPRALLAATLLAALPLHVRFSAAEDLFIYAFTFALWSTAFFLVYLRTGTILSALAAGISLALAVQTRPEMILFPALLALLGFSISPRGWRFLFEWRTIFALVIVAVLLVPRVVELSQVVGQSTSPSFHLPYLGRYLDRLVLLHGDATPRVYVALLAMGLVVGLRRRAVATLWPIAAFLTFSLFSASIFDNPPYHMRSQVLPTSFTVIVAAACADVALTWLRARGPSSIWLSCLGLLAVGLALVIPARGYIVERRDQQLEWDFLEKAIPQLPPSGKLLTLVKPALDAFPEILLRANQKAYEILDAEPYARGEADWPANDESLLFYRGMYCYFAFEKDPPPEPMSPVCRAVTDAYELEPVLIETLMSPGFSWLVYSGEGKRPFEIGFYRLKRR